MPTPITKKGYDALKSELDRLRKIERPKVIEAIAEARAHGDLSENAEYDAAKERQGFIESRISELETKLQMPAWWKGGTHHRDGRLRRDRVGRRTGVPSEKAIYVSRAGRSRHEVQQDLRTVPCRSCTHREACRRFRGSEDPCQDGRIRGCGDQIRGMLTCRTHALHHAADGFRRA